MNEVFLEVEMTDQTIEMLKRLEMGIALIDGSIIKLKEREHFKIWINFLISSQN